MPTWFVNAPSSDLSLSPQPLVSETFVHATLPLLFKSAPNGEPPPAVPGPSFAILTLASLYPFIRFIRRLTARLSHSTTPMINQLDIT